MMITKLQAGLLLSLLVGLAAVMAIVGGAVSARPLLTSCIDSHGPEGAPLGIRSYHNMSCTQVKRAISHGNFGYGHKKFTTPGFRCASHLIPPGDPPTYSYACAAGSRSFKFVVGT
jgi:hypothetical protein